MADQAPWRLIDLGDRTASEYVAFNRTLLESRQEGIAPNTFTFLRFAEPSALVGYHQNVDQELRREYCEENDIVIQRRISGGGALYVDPSVIGWELYLDRKTLGTADMSEIARRVCETAAEAFSKFGIDARFRPRNDIEVDGRKIAGTGGTYDGDVLLYHGSLLIDTFDVEKMLRMLKIPAEKMDDKAVSSARERVTDLQSLLGEAPALEDVKRVMVEAFSNSFGAEIYEEPDISEREKEIFSEFLEEVRDPEWVDAIQRPTTEAVEVEGAYKGDGGLVRAAVYVDTRKNRIKQVLLTGDFFVNPKRAIADLEARLKDVRVDEFRDIIRDFFAQEDIETLNLHADDFIITMDKALEGLNPA